MRGCEGGLEGRRFRGDVRVSARRSVALTASYYYNAAAFPLSVDDDDDGVVVPASALEAPDNRDLSGGCGNRDLIRRQHIKRRING